MPAKPIAVRARICLRVAGNPLRAESDVTLRCIDRPSVNDGFFSSTPRVVSVQLKLRRLPKRDWLTFGRLMNASCQIAFGQKASLSDQWSLSRAGTCSAASVATLTTRLSATRLVRAECTPQATWSVGLAGRMGGTAISAPAAAWRLELTCPGAESGRSADGTRNQMLPCRLPGWLVV